MEDNYTLKDLESEEEFINEIHECFIHGFEAEIEEYLKQFAEKHSPDNPNLLVLESKLYALRNQFDKVKANVDVLLKNLTSFSGTDSQKARLELMIGSIRIYTAILLNEEYDFNSLFEHILSVYQDIRPEDRDVLVLDLYSIVLSRKGGYHFNEQEFDLAIATFEQNYQIRKDMGNKEDMIFAMDNIAVCYQEMGEHERAIEIQLDILPVIEEVSTPKNHALHLNDIGSAYAQLNNLEKAEEYYIQSINIFTEINEWKAEFGALHLLEELYQKQGKDVEAKTINERKLSLYQKHSLAN